jgi:hypothetical protein
MPSPARRKIRLPVALLALSVSLALVSPLPAAGDAGAAAGRFGRALTAGDVDALADLLPKTGKVRLLLLHFGPQDGYFSGGQVRAVFADYFDQASVSSVKILRVQRDEGVSLVQTEAALIDRLDRARNVRLQLTFRLEGDRWVLRELREHG